MAEGYDIDTLKAMGLSDEAIAEIMAFDLAQYQANYQANAKANQEAEERGLSAAQATGLSDRYVPLNTASGYDLIPGTNAQIMGNLGLIPQSYDYAPVFNIKGDQEYENYNFVPVPGKTYRLVDNNTGEVIGTATNAAEAKGLAEAANAISEKMGGNANWALQEYGSWSDGKGNMTSGYSDVYTNKKTGFVNDVSMLVQAAGIMAMAGAGLAAATAQTAATAGATAASSGASAAINSAAASTAASSGLSAASKELLTQVGMGALRGGITSAALGGDPIKGAVTGAFSTLGSEVIGPLVESVKGAGEVATNFGSSVGAAAGTTVGSLVTGQNLENSFINGLISGASQYVSTEVAEELAEAKRLREAAAKDAISDQVDNSIRNSLSIKDPIAAREMLKFDLDEIVVNAGKEFGSELKKWAADLIASEFSGFLETQSDVAESARTTSGIADLSEAARENLIDQIDAIQDQLVITGSSAAGITAANQAIQDLIVNARAKYGDRGANFIESYVINGIGKLINVNAPDTGKETDTTAGIGGLDLTATAPTTPASNATTAAGIGDLGIIATAPTAPPPTSLPPTLVPTFVPPTDITVTATTSPPTSAPPTTFIPTTFVPPTDITVTATSTPPTSAPPTTFIPTTFVPPTDITVTATSTPPTSAPPTTFIPTTFVPPTSAPPTGEPTRPPTWTTKDWVMLGLAVPNLINSIVGKGEDVGTITPDRSAVTFNPLNRQRGIGSFDPFTYGQEGPGRQTSEFEFFQPYSAAQPTQTYTPTTVSWTPGADIYKYTPEEFEAMKADAATQYGTRSASFNNYQQMLAKQVESGALTLDQALAEARAYAEPFGGAIIPQKADGGYIGYADGGEPEDDMIKHLMEYRKGGGHQGPGQVKGIGSGQEDKIPAWLSDGEYVWSAQDVADLGDGSTDEGVRRLDKMRQMVRKQAGRKDVKKIAKPQKGIEQMLKAVGGKA